VALDTIQVSGPATAKTHPDLHAPPWVSPQRRSHPYLEGTIAFRTRSGTWLASTISNAMTFLDPRPRLATDR
jgi:hypothetical protein